MQIRSPLRIQHDVVLAILIQEIRARVAGFALGLGWIFVEPLILIGLFVFMFGLRGRGAFGFIEPAVFVLTGFIPFRLIWNKIMPQTMNGGQRAGQYLQYRQVQVLDVVLAQSVLNFLQTIVVTIVMIVILAWLGFDSLPRDPAMVIVGMVLLAVFSVAFGLMAMVAGRLASEIKTVISILTMPLMFTSAVMFPMTIVPEPYRTQLAYNPLVHPIEFIREAWVDGYVGPVTDMGYFGAWLMLSMFFGLALYRLDWKKVVRT